MEGRDSVGVEGEEASAAGGGGWMGLPGQRAVKVDVGAARGLVVGAGGLVAGGQGEVCGAGEVQTSSSGEEGGGQAMSGALWVGEGVGGVRVRVMPVRGQRRGEEVVQRGGRWGFGVGKNSQKVIALQYLLCNVPIY
jgi:hypothetical protein